jgi:hypothetical protein
MVPGSGKAAPSGTSGHALAFSLIGLFILAAILSTSAVALAIARSEIGDGVYRFALVPSVVTIVAMALVLGSVIAWGIGVQIDTPQLYSGNHGMFASSTAGSWIGHIITMALAVAIALLGLVRALGRGQTPQRVAPAA